MPSNATSVIFRHRSPGLAACVDRRDLRRFFKDLAQEILPGQSVNCLIAADKDLQSLNRKFRGKDYAADVLSFPPDDIAISFDRAARQAVELGHSSEIEVRILMLHGLLHLAGMDHENDRGAMARAEARWRKRLGLPAGLIERTPL
jgi:probable rRNA maturation factor